MEQEKKSLDTLQKEISSAREILLTKEHELTKREQFLSESQHEFVKSKEELLNTSQSLHSELAVVNARHHHLQELAQQLKDR